MLIEPPVVKETKFRCQAAEHPNQRELRGDDVNDKAVSCLLGECVAVLGFALHLRQRLPGEEKTRVQIPDRSPTILDFDLHNELIKGELPMLRIEKESKGHTTTLWLSGRIQSANIGNTRLK